MAQRISQVQRETCSGWRRRALSQPSWVLANRQVCSISKPVDVGPPDQVQVRDAGPGPPQPQRPRRFPAVREPGDGDPDQVAPDDRRRLEAGEPAAAEQLRVQPAPRLHADVAVPVVIKGQLPVRRAPGRPVLALKPAALAGAVDAGPARPARDPRRRVPVQHPVIADADQDLHPVQLIAQVPGQRGLAVAAVEHIQRDPRLPGRAQPGRVRDDLPRGLPGRIISGTRAHLILRRGPGIWRKGQLGQPLERPPRHHRAAVPGAVAVPGVPGMVPRTAMMMPLPARAGLRRRPRVRARVDREHRRPVPRPHRDQQVPQRLLIDPPLIQGLVDHAVPAAERPAPGSGTAATPPARALSAPHPPAPPARPGTATGTRTAAS